MSVLRLAIRARMIALAVAVGAAMVLLAMSTTSVPAAVTGICDVVLAYGAAVAIAAWVHERQQLRSFHDDVVAFLRAQA